MANLTMKPQNKTATQNPQQQKAATAVAPPQTQSILPKLTVQMGVAIVTGNIGDMGILIKKFRAAGLPTNEQSINIAGNDLYQQALSRLQKTGRLSELVPEMQYTPQNIQAKIMDSLPPQIRVPLSTALLGGEKNLSADAFIEQLASNLVYANDLEFRDDKSPTGGKKVDGKSQQGSGKELLKAFKYAATPVYLGNWGLQMRVFYPLEGAKLNHVVVAFRGTETVVMPLAKLAKAENTEKFRFENEKDLDTATDMSKADTAYTQYNQNVDLIDRVVAFAKGKKKGGSLVSTGHSLGGGLAQIAAAKHAEFTQLLTFQAPGINPEHVKQLEARNKVDARGNSALKIRNYRTTYDSVPYAGKGQFPGLTFSFERSMHTIPGDLATAGANNHNFPMLAEFLEVRQKAGYKLTAEDKAILTLGKQSPAEKKGGDDAAMLLSRSSNATILRSGNAQSQIMPAVWGNHINNAVANNLIYNNIVDEISKDIRKITPKKIKERGAVWHGNRLGYLGKSIVEPWKFVRLSEKNRSAIKDYIDDTDNPFLMEVGAIKKAIDTLMDISAQLGESNEGKLKVFRLALTLNGVESDRGSEDIIQENKQRVKLNMPSLWYSEFVDQQKIYEEVNRIYVV